MEVRQSPPSEALGSLLVGGPPKSPLPPNRPRGGPLSATGGAGLNLLPIVQSSNVSTALESLSGANPVRRGGLGLSSILAGGGGRFERQSLFVSATETGLSSANFDPPPSNRDD